MSLHTCGKTNDITCDVHHGVLGGFSGIPMTYQNIPIPNQTGIKKKTCGCTIKINKLQTLILSFGLLTSQYNIFQSKTDIHSIQVYSKSIGPITI